MNKNTENKIQQMQILEQQIQHLNSQKQQLQIKFTEIGSAIEELQDKDTAYKILGGIMIKQNAKDLNKSLNEQQDVLTLKIQKIEEQEEKIHMKAKKIQQEVLKEMKGGENE